MFHRLSFAGVALLSVSLATGCGPKEGPKADVSGKITFQGKPVTAGSISFIKDDIVAAGAIKNGEYKVIGAPIGLVKIGIVTPAAPPEKQMKQKVEGKSFSGDGGGPVVSVPPKFSNPDASGLTYTVTEGAPQTHDIEIP